jgi:hypothetical protein
MNGQTNSRKAMMRHRFLEALDLCAVPAMALAIAIASTQSGGQGRERNLDRNADAVAVREVMMRLTGLHYGNAQGVSTMSDGRSAWNLLNPREAPTPTVPDFRF